MSDFGPTYIVEPRDGHTHEFTAVLLHGRGSTGEDFADELFETSLSDQRPDGQPYTLADRLPTWKWVFPSSPRTWNATFEEWLPAWFEAQSLADPKERQDLQQSGLRASSRHVAYIIEEEIQRLGGPDAHNRLVFGGISIGGALAFWALLSTNRPERPLGGFAALSTWMPFADKIQTFLGGSQEEAYVPQLSQAETDDDKPAEPLVFVQNSMRALNQQMRTSATPSILTTPVFLGHGRDDAYVDVELGRQAQKVLSDVGFAAIEWKDYEGAEQEGHWLKEPEEMDDHARFLEAVASRSK